MSVNQSALLSQQLQQNQQILLSQATSAQQTTGAAQAQTALATDPVATAMYNPTLQLFDSLLILEAVLKNPPQTPSVPQGCQNLNEEIAYTLFAQSVCNWESAYQSTEKENGGSLPSSSPLTPFTQTIQNDLTATLPCGQSIYQLCQTVSANPSQWQLLQQNVPNSQLSNLLVNTNDWIGEDQSMNVQNPTWWIDQNTLNSNSEISKLQAVYNMFCNPNSPTYYNPDQPATGGEINNMIYAIDGAFWPAWGSVTSDPSTNPPLLTLMWDFANTPFFNVDLNGSGSSQPESLYGICQWYVADYGNSETPLPPQDITMVQGVINSCLGVMQDLLLLANQAYGLIPN
ncbi:MAG: hypothetical protein JSR93_10505 [Verrucomicrobia bacterium]|nr:hypothetical protein [Verrucomicrobiota bacterium]